MSQNQVLITSLVHKLVEVSEKSQPTVIEIDDPDVPNEVIEGAVKVFRATHDFNGQVSTFFPYGESLRMIIVTPVNGFPSLSD